MLIRKGKRMEEKTIYYISEAAKKVQVENHVLRYWEEELQLPIKRNEMGHRYYTEQDVKQLQEIKLLKEQGLQLKAIRTVLFKMPALSSGNEKDRPAQEVEKIAEMQVEQLSDKISDRASTTLDKISDRASTTSDKISDRASTASDKISDRVSTTLDNISGDVSEKTVGCTEHGEMMALSNGKDASVEQKQDDDVEKNQKAARLQYLLQHMITEAVRSANRELCTEVKNSIIKELDYQFRMQEERDDERWKIEEEHYRKIDEMIRERHKPKEKLGRGKKKI